MTQTTFWTFECIDYELLRDEPKSADGISPMLLWQTETAARDAAEREIAQQVRDGLIELDFPPEWEQVVIDHRDGTTGWKWSNDDDDETVVFRVFPMKVVTTLEDMPPIGGRAQ